MRIVDRQHVLSFEGGYVQIGRHADFDLTDAITIAAWVRPTVGYALQATVLSKNYATYEPQVQHGRFVFERGPEYKSSAKLPMHRWAHLAVTFDVSAPQGNVKLYINGKLDRAHNVTSPMATSNHYLLIGKRPGWDDGLFQGQMAGLAIWRNARPAWQVRQEMNGRINLDDPDLVAYWRMAEGEGETVRDASGNAHHGTIKGGVQWAAPASPVAADLPERGLRRHTSVTRMAALLDAGGAHPARRGKRAAPTAAESADVPPKQLPPSGRGGESTKFLNRVKLYNQQRVHDHQVEASARLQEAKHAAAAKVQEAHAEAAKKINSTRFDYLYFIHAGHIHRVDPKHELEKFFVGNVETVTSDVAARQLWQGTGIAVGPTDTLLIRYVSGNWSISPAASNLTATGARQYRAKQGYAMPGKPEGSLIGRIGTTVFYVGQGTTAPPGLEGELELIANDDLAGGFGAGYADNSGSITVEITREKQPVSVHATDVSIDQERKRIFWAQAIVPFTLHSADLDGNDHSVVVSEPGRPITSVAVETEGQRVFYIAGTGGIYSVGYDGSGHQLVLDITGPAREHMWQLEVDNDTKQLFWTNDFGIWRAGLDGSDARLVVPAADAPFPIDLAVDGEGGRLYWIDKELGMLRGAALDGSQPDDLYAVDHPLRGLALDFVSDEFPELRREVYWSAWEDTIGPATPGIVGHWKLDEGDGLTIHNSARDTPDLVVGGAAFDASELPPNMSAPHHSLRITGPADYVRFPQPHVAAVTGKSFTVQVWVRPDVLPTWDAPIMTMALPHGVNQTLHLTIREKRAYLGFWANDIAGGTELVAGRWTHLAYRYDAEQREQAIFVNGELDGVGKDRDPLEADPDRITMIGRWYAYQFTGHIADLHVASRALSQAEIKASLTLHKPGDVVPSIRIGPTWEHGDAPPVVYPPRAVLSFDGISDYVKMGTASELGLAGSSFTVECWFKVAGFAPYDLPLLGTDTAGHLQGLHLVVRDQRLHLGFTGSGASGGTVLEAGRWYHAAFRYDAAAQEQAIFLNGQRDATNTPSPPLEGREPVYLGRWRTDQLFHGLISDLRIWDVARTDQEIRANMRNYRETFALRGPIDGSAAPEHLFDIPSEGGMQLVSKLSVEHEERVLAYRERKAAQERATREVGDAHAESDAKVAAKNDELKRTHAEKEAEIDAKRTEHEQDRADNRRRLAQAQTDSRRKIDHAISDATRKREDAHVQASDITDKARADADKMKRDARADRDAARRERDKHR
ncbi:MAG: hypothetical protein QNJ12_16210 [Ilumatobacter sp.]|uniref:LamG-like jellyroll fold domain-containing protein n=1 Tax=Ilumatobacter sp. TaxID=1967498 RepID=UPI00261471F8|nr:LamG-like jellyroll fold domain-containing protein [Ilumatobacter sp.]MDJ0770343.1 hypothetical protein [Ilumatobacter sp.]